MKAKLNYPKNSCGKKGCWTDWTALPYGQSTLVIDSKLSICEGCKSPAKCRANGKCANNGRS